MIPFYANFDAISDEFIYTSNERKEEVIKMIQRTLQNMGFQKSANMLAEESGITCSNPKSEQFEKYFIEGDWLKTIEIVKTMEMTTEKTEIILFDLHKMIYIQAIYSGDFSKATELLRNELSSTTQKRTEELESLSYLLLYSTHQELTDSLKFDINSVDDRKRLLISIQKKIQKGNEEEKVKLFPPNRLEQLFSQSICYQIIQDPYFHESNLKEFPTLVSDFKSKKPKAPVHQVSKISGLDSEVGQICFSSDSQYIAVTTTKKTLYLFKILDSAGMSNFELIKLNHNIHDLEITGIAFIPRGKKQGNNTPSLLVTVSRDEIIKLWKNGVLKKSDSEGHKDPILSISVMKSGKGFITGDERGVVIVWKAYGEKKYSFKGSRSAITRLSPDDSLLYMTSGTRKKILIYNLLDQEEADVLKENNIIISFDLQKRSKENKEPQRMVTAVNIHEPELHLWDLKTKKVINKYYGFYHTIFELVVRFFGKKSNLLCMGDEKGDLCIWHINISSPIHRIDSGHSMLIGAMSLSNGVRGREGVVATGSEDKSVIIWGCNSVPKVGGICIGETIEEDAEALVRSVEEQSESMDIEYQDTEDRMEIVDIGMFSTELADNSSAEA